MAIPLPSNGTTRIDVAYVSLTVVVVVREGRRATIGWAILRAAARQFDAVLRAPYAELLAAAERKMLVSMQANARAAVVSCRGHRASQSVERSFFGSVSRDENRAAHGGVCLHETCLCGAQRRRNVNGRHEEIGSWMSPELSLQDVRALTEA